MSTPNDGGPAFPSPALPHATDGRDEPRDGMSLRDWFAGQAMQAVVTGMNMRGKELGDDNTQFVTDCCYEIADAMLRSRKEGAAS